MGFEFLLHRHTLKTQATDFNRERWEFWFWRPKKGRMGLKWGWRAIFTIRLLCAIGGY
jgi:hypothetical protein